MIVRSRNPHFNMGLPPDAIYLTRLDDQGKPVGSFAWNGHAAGAIQMHYHGTHKYWMTREFLRQAFTYPFVELGVKVILAFLPEDRLHARDVAIKLGFRPIGMIPGVRLHMLTMVREDCKWVVQSVGSQAAL